MGMKHNFDIGSMTAFDITIKMKQKSFYSHPFLVLSNILDDKEDKCDDCFHSTQIVHSKYDKADVKTISLQQNHLTPSQQEELQTILSGWTKLFSGELGHYPHKKMDLELLPSAKPIHAKPHPIPRKQLVIF
jgi:hypothetical protein